MSNLLHRMYEPKVYEPHQEPRLRRVVYNCDADCCGDPIYENQDCVLLADGRIIHERCAEYLGLKGQFVHLDRLGNLHSSTGQPLRWEEA